MRDVALTALSLGVQRTRAELSAGEELRFGNCRCNRCGIELEAVGANGHIHAATTWWSITNHSNYRPILVRSMERPTEYVTVLPNEADAPMKWDIAIVEGAAGDVLEIYGPSAPRCECIVPCADAELANAPELRRDSEYFRVLVALCEMRLAGDHTVPLPTARHIGRRLGMKPRNVDAAITYMIKKFDLEKPRNVHHWKREAIAVYAIRQGLVTTSDLKRFRERARTVKRVPATEGESSSGRRADGRR